ncbi:hypothetical protein Osc1_19920 [Hominimerdicola sp. 21CYCFAH17_S]
MLTDLLTDNITLLFAKPVIRLIPCTLIRACVVVVVLLDVVVTAAETAGCLEAVGGAAEAV